MSWSIVCRGKDLLLTPTHSSTSITVSRWAKTISEVSKDVRLSALAFEGMEACEGTHVGIGLRSHSWDHFIILLLLIQTTILSSYRYGTSIYRSMKRSPTFKWSIQRLFAILRPSAKPPLAASRPQCTTAATIMVASGHYPSPPEDPQ